jgi:hypothetical protein
MRGIHLTLIFLRHRSTVGACPELNQYHLKVGIIHHAVAVDIFWKLLAHLTEIEQHTQKVEVVYFTAAIDVWAARSICCSESYRIMQLTAAAIARLILLIVLLLSWGGRFGW